MSAVLPGISNNLRAFLDMIAYAEGTSTSPATVLDGYDVIVTGAEGVPEIFDDFSNHPFDGGRKSKVINDNGLRSNASGRYQFMKKDWRYYRALLKLPDFSPKSQDIWAIQLIKERGALPDVEAGRFVMAVRKCRNIWASLPGAGYGQREHQIERLAKAYVNAGGKLA